MVLSVEIMLSFVMKFISIFMWLLPALSESFPENVVRQHSLVEPSVPWQWLIQFHVLFALFLDYFSISPGVALVC